MDCSHTIIPASEGHLFACPGSRIGSRVRWIRLSRSAAGCWPCAERTRCLTNLDPLLARTHPASGWSAASSSCSNGLSGPPIAVTGGREGTRARGPAHRRADDDARVLLGAAEAMLAEANWQPVAMQGISLALHVDKWSSVTKNWVEQHPFAALVALETLLALALGLLFLGDKSFWLDEATTARLVGLDWASLRSELGDTQTNQAPLLHRPQDLGGHRGRGRILASVLLGVERCSGDPGDRAARKEPLLSASRGHCRAAARSQTRSS